MSLGIYLLSSRSPRRLNAVVIYHPVKVASLLCASCRIILAPGEARGEAQEEGAPARGGVRAQGARRRRAGDGQAGLRGLEQAEREHEAGPGEEGEAAGRNERGDGGDEEYPGGHLQPLQEEERKGLKEKIDDSSSQPRTTMMGKVFQY